MRYCIVVSLLLSITISCAKKTSKEEPDVRLEAVKKNTLALHDELMVEMHELNVLKKELQQFVNIESDSLLKLDAKKAIKHLEAADSAMWDWMHNFDITYESTNDSVRFRYFNEQHLLLMNVDGLYKRSIFESEKLLHKTN